MSKKSSKSRSLNLCVASPLVERFNSEIDFLGLGDRAYAVEEKKEIRNKSEFLRWIVDSYIQRRLDSAEEQEAIDLDEKREIIPLYLNRQSEGLWNVALNGKVASDYNQLVESALYYYFLRQEAIAEKLRSQLEEYKELLKTANPVELAAIA